MYLEPHARCIKSWLRFKHSACIPRHYCYCYADCWICIDVSCREAHLTVVHILDIKTIPRLTLYSRFQNILLKIYSSNNNSNSNLYTLEYIAVKFTFNNNYWRWCYWILKMGILTVEFQNRKSLNVLLSEPMHTLLYYLNYDCL